MAEIGRLITAMITPFNEQGEVNYDEAKNLALALVDSGSDGLVVTGTTGESPNLSDEEKLRLYKEIKGAVGDRAAVIAGTTGNNTAASIELSQEAEKLGVDGILLTVPSYNKPQQEGLIEHFTAIAGSVDLPCMLYDVPSRTALHMNSATTVRLSEINNIIGIKDASSDLDETTRIIRDARPGFRVWSGNDNETFYIMAVGGYGVVSVASHLVGSQIKAMMGMILEGEIEKAAGEHRRLHDIFKVLFTITSPVPVKYAVNKAGFNVGNTRLPLVPPTEAVAAEVDSVISRYHIDLPVAVAGDN